MLHAKKHSVKYLVNCIFLNLGENIDKTCYVNVTFGSLCMFFENARRDWDIGMLVGAFNMICHGE